MEVAILRLLHIVSGILWVGGAFLFGIFLIPAVREAGPAGGPVMGGMVKRKLPLWIAVFAIVTILCGLRLFMINVGGSPEYLFSPTGICLLIGATFALVAFAFGMAVQRPTADKMGKLGAAIQAQGTPPSAEQQAEMKRLSGIIGKVAKRTAILLLHAAIFMAGSRLAGTLFQ
ncbi:MAG: hypothetical protein V4498_10220 [candidate division FCPU426 bacterium]